MWKHLYIRFMFFVVVYMNSRCSWYIPWLLLLLLLIFFFFYYLLSDVIQADICICIRKNWAMWHRAKSICVVIELRCTGYCTQSTKWKSNLFVVTHRDTWNGAQTHIFKDTHTHDTTRHDTKKHSSSIILPRRFYNANIFYCLDALSIMI